MQVIIHSVDGLGLTLADHNHRWTDREPDVYEQTIDILTSWDSDCRGSDSLVSEIALRQTPCFE